VDTSGNWSQFGNNILSSSSLGASVWEARTNSIRNNTMAGAIVQADGVELITNGNAFPSGSAGWTVATSGGGVVDFSIPGQCHITGDGSTNGNYISQQVTGLVVGRNYVVTIATSVNPTCQVAVGTSAGNASIVGFTAVVGNGNTSSAADRISFTATSSSAWVTVARSPANIGTIISVSVQDGERCQNGGFTSSPLNAAQGTVQNGWQWSNNAGTGTVTYVGGNSVQILGDGTHAAVIGTIALPTVSGFTYTITLDITGNNANVVVGTSALNNQIATFANQGPGTGLKFQFTATSATSYVSVSRTGAVTSTVANVSVQSAGALPTNWPNLTGLNSGVVAQVTNLGTESGINYIDLQWVGTSTGAGASPQIVFESNTQIAALYGQTWTSSLFAYVSGGSTANLSAFNHGFDENQSGGTFIASHLTSFTPSSVGPLGSNRLLNSATVNASNAGVVKPYINFHFAGSVAVNITYRIGWPQLENNSLINSTVASAVMAASGSGGVNGSAVYSVGGGAGPTTATLNVTWTAGVMAVNSVANAGSYTTFPPSPSTLTYVSGTATGWTGATVTLTPTNNASQAAASNPILTTSAAATRNAESDALVLTGLPGFGAAYTAYVRWTPRFPAVSASNQTAIQVDANADSQRSLLRRDKSTGKCLAASVGGGGFGNTSVAVFAQNVSTKWALAEAASDQNEGFDGTLGPASSVASLPTTPTVVRIGSTQGLAEQTNGDIEEIAIWFTQRLPNATLQAITT
jgi:hypothetical protein